MKLEGRDILIISNEVWGDVWYSKHHFAHALSANNRVWFINPPQRFHKGALMKPAPALTSVSENLKVITYTNPLPGSGPSDAIFAQTERLVAGAIRKLLKRQGVNRTVFWSFDPFRLLNPKALKADFSLYHSMDDYKNRRESVLTKRVDGIVSVSQRIADKFSEIKVPQLVQPHGVPGKPISEKELLEARTTNQILLMGTFNERIDFRLLLDVAHAFPNYRLVLAGPVLRDGLGEFAKDVTELERTPNVDFIGPKPYSEIEKLIQSSQLTLVALRQNQIGNRLNSLKVMQYLRWGKPVVSTWLIDQEKNAEAGLLRLAKDRDEFLYFCRQFLENADSQEEILRRSNFTQQFGYPALIGQLEAFLSTISK